MRYITHLRKISIWESYQKKKVKPPHSITTHSFIKHSKAEALQNAVSKSECFFWLYSDSLLGGLVSRVSREKGEILGEWRESRNHRTSQGSSIHDNKKSKNKKPQQRYSKSRREQMLPQATTHAMLLAPANQTHAHNPNQTIPQRHLHSRNISLLAFNQVLTASLDTIHSSKAANFTKLLVITLQTDPFSCLCLCSCSI